ncbi:MAG: (d)CMP kinase [Candidatus Altiarchaeota archaeon]
MIIAVGGSAASGKTTLAKALAERLGLKHISAGEIMREMAAEQGVSLLEFSKAAEGDYSIDRVIDERQKTQAAKGDCVVDGRLSAFMIPQSDLKVFLTAPFEVRAKRIFEREKDTLKSIIEAKTAVLEREASEAKRYAGIYDIDLNDLSVYDLIVNTEKWGIKETQELIEKAVTLLGP